MVGSGLGFEGLRWIEDDLVRANLDPLQTMFDVSLD